MENWRDFIKSWILSLFCHSSMYRSERDIPCTAMKSISAKVLFMINLVRISYYFLGMLKKIGFNLKVEVDFLMEMHVLSAGLYFVLLRIINGNTQILIA